jgi:hypothetical protein
MANIKTLCVQIQPHRAPGIAVSDAAARFASIGCITSIPE